MKSLIKIANMKNDIEVETVFDQVEKRYFTIVNVDRRFAK